MTDSRETEELTLAELPAAGLLEDCLNYDPLTGTEVDGLRSSPGEAILRVRVEEALKRLNPWIDDDNIRRTLGAISRLSGVDLLEINEAAHTAITYGVSVPHTDEHGRRKDRTVKFIDFENIGNNRFEYARQHRVRGPRQEIIPDIAIFVNGLPLAVIECKAPGLPDPVDEGITQFRRYQGEGEFAGLGAPRLFETAQLHLVLARTEAKYGTTGTPYRFWADWKQPWPLDLDTLARKIGRPPTAQDVTLYGLLEQSNLLDFVRNFIVFETVQGRRVKKIARYQQFIAVQEAVKRIETARRAGRRGGIIFHTQGSGKSFTMVFLAMKLRRLRSAENPTIVIVTDRTDLDEQISATFKHCGFPNPVQAESGRHLREVLSTGAGPTVLTTVHKFHTAVPTKDDVITDAQNVFVLADEAHRTQYSRLAARMRAGLPNACLIAFTGTPIDKHDRSTRKAFGDYIHRYPIDRAVRDGATVPIYYEMRDPRLRIEGKDLERELRVAFPNLSDEQLDELRRHPRLGETIATSPKRIESVCRDLLNHYRSTIEPNGFKAQVVTVNREAAVAYQEMLDQMEGPESVVIMSGSNDDNARLKRHHLTPKERERMIERFKDADDPLKVLVVCDMLLTGFDAPVEQVMYLDAPLREHTLLQAIARVNRTADGPKGPKTHGLVVDYWGDNRRIAEALAMFSEDDLSGTLLSRSERIAQMQARHRATMRFFDGVDRSDDEACLQILEAEDMRATFDIAFRRFAESVDMVLPDPAALEEPYLGDLTWLARIRAQANRRYRDERLNFKHYGAKVRELVEQHLSAEGVEQLLEPLSILAPEFQDQLRRLQSDEARASEMEHAIRHEIHVHRDENPAVFASLWEQLERFINDRREARVTAASALDHLQSLADDVQDAVRGGAQTANDGLTGTAGALHSLLKDSFSNANGQVRDTAREIAAELEDLAVIDWHQKEDVKRQMRRSVKGHLRKAGLEAKSLESMTARIMDVARARLTR